MEDLANVTVAILAGGLGTRLRLVVVSKPKVLAEIRGQPFLKFLLDRLDSTGFKEVVVCTGYLGNKVQAKFGNTYGNLKLRYSQEFSPLDTAGAVRLALPLLKSDTVMVMNGDSFCSANLVDFVKFHFQKKANATILLTKVADTSRYGRVDVDQSGKIMGFQEKKENSGAGWINAGIYLISRSYLSEISGTGAVSFEKDLFLNWINRGFYGYQSRGRFIDIGTRESFAFAKQFFQDKKMRQKRFVLLDRDGTIILERDHLTDYSQVELIPKAAQALKKLRDLRLGLIIITNQSVVGRGHIDLAGLEKIHKRMVDLLSKDRAAIDGIYFCPHTQEDNCSCRKPKLGLIKKALKEHKFDPSSSFVIGDKAIDIELGQKMGATTFLVRTGYGTKVDIKMVKPDYMVDDLSEAADIIQSLI